MSTMDLIWLIALIGSHACAYYFGVSADPDPFKPSNEAWVAVQCHAIDKRYEHERWLAEHVKSEAAAPSGD